MKNCSTCKHWQQRKHQVVQGLGECHAQPPSASFSWPKTRPADFCSGYNQGNTFDADGGTPSLEPTPPPRDLFSDTENGAVASVKASRKRGNGGPRLRQKP